MKVSDILSTRPTWAARYQLGYALGRIGKGPRNECFPASTRDYAVRENHRLGTTAGLAFGHSRMELHPFVLAQPCRKPQEAEETFFHELAHLIADELGSRGHDATWGWIFNCFGYHPRRCHQISRAEMADLKIDLSSLDLDL